MRLSLSVQTGDGRSLHGARWRRCVPPRGAVAAGRAHAVDRRAHEHNCDMIRNSNPASRYSCKHSLSSRESDLRDPCPTYCLPMPKSRGRKPKKKRAPTSAPKKRLDNFNTTPQELPLSTQPPQEPPPLATAPRQEQPTPKIKKIAKLTMAVVLAAIAIVLCAYAFILTKQ